MTTKLPKIPHNIDEYFRADVLPDDPEPIEDGMQQSPTLIEILHVLADRVTNLGRRPDVLLDTGGFIYYDPTDRNVRVGPDCYIAFGVDAERIIRRNGYVIWEVGKPPDFALEIASPSTSRRDLTFKRGIYASLGITEYWRFDPTGGNNYGEPIVGEQLVEGEYQRFPLSTTPEGIVWAHSSLLGLDFCSQDGHLRFYDPAAGEYLRMIDEERAAREAAEAEVLRLQEELRRLRGE